MRNQAWKILAIYAVVLRDNEFVVHNVLHLRRLLLHLLLFLVVVVVVVLALTAFGAAFGKDHPAKWNCLRRMHY